MIDIVSSLARPSVGLLVKKLSCVSSNFNENGEESKIHPLTENFDDTSQYIDIESVRTAMGCS